MHATNLHLSYFLPLSDTGKKSRSTIETVRKISVDFKKTYDSVRRGVLYNYSYPLECP
jgi:hypothetical protein